MRIAVTHINTGIFNAAVEIGLVVIAGIPRPIEGLAKPPCPHRDHTTLNLFHFSSGKLRKSI